MQPYNDEQRSYEQGYSPAPQFTAPPPTYYYPPQVPQSQQYTPYPQPQQQYPYPYPQQQMMPQITINNNVNQSTVIAQKLQLNMWVRLVYFLLIGWWLGLMWLCVAIALICTFIGAPVGIVMLALLPVIATLHR